MVRLSPAGGDAGMKATTFQGKHFYSRLKCRSKEIGRSPTCMRKSVGKVVCSSVAPVEPNMPVDTLGVVGFALAVVRPADFLCTQRMGADTSIRLGHFSAASC